MTDFINIHKNSNPWNYLSKDIACEIISHITNFGDILNFRKVSKRFLKHVTFCSTQLTSDEMVHISSNILKLFPKLKYIDHKIGINIDNINDIKSLKHLEHAYFLIDNPDLIKVILKSLHRLKHSYHYFKIGVTMTEKFIGFLRKNNKSIIIPKSDSHYIDEKIEDFPSMPPAIAYNTDIFERKLLKMPLIQFINNEDFGLVDPTQPPSINNPPLSDYIFDHMDCSNISTIISLLYIYMLYHTLTISKIKYSFDSVLKFYFQQQIDKYNLKQHPNNKMDTNDFTRMKIGNICYLNILNVFTDEELSEYKFPNIVSLDIYNEIDNIINKTMNIYKTLKSGSPHDFYDTNNNIRTLNY